MKINSILYRYLARQFFVNFLLILGLLFFIIFMLDSLEMLRKTSGRAHITFEMCIKIAFFKLPDVGQKIFPFAILFSSLFTLFRLARTQELVIARTAGLSVWQFLMPLILTAFLIGIFETTLFNPISALFIEKSKEMENRFVKGRTSAIKISDSGLWFRQFIPQGHYFIYAEQIDPQKMHLKNVSIFFFEDKNYLPSSRLDAEQAELHEHEWVVKNGWLNKFKSPPEHLNHFKLETDLTRDHIEKSFSPPETMAFWNLPGFINHLTQNGFSAARHRLYFQSLLAQPFLFSGMVLMAAIFGLNRDRFKNYLFLITGGILTGLSLFIFGDILMALGLAGTIPLYLAAWAPPFLALFIGIAILIHQEDG